MNIILKLYKFKCENIQYLDTKKNIIMNGNFTKIIYSDNNITLNGIYIDCPFSIEQLDNSFQTNMIFNLDNTNFFNEIIKIENDILTYYKDKNKLLQKVNWGGFFKKIKYDFFKKIQYPFKRIKCIFRKCTKKI